MDQLSRRGWISLALGIAALAVAGGLFYRSEKEASFREANEQLAAVARLKADQVAAWRRECLLEVAELAEDPALPAALSHWLAGTARATETTWPILHLSSCLRRGPYSDAALTDARGRVLWSVSGQRAPLDSATVQALTTALAAGLPVLTDLHQEPGAEPSLEAVAPLIEISGQQRHPVGGIVLKCPAKQSLYPLLGSWPLTSRSGEVLLVERVGDVVLFLSPLRYRPDPPLTLQIPLTRTEVPAVQAVLGHESVAEGRDYRDEPVLVALRRVPDSPWHLVVKEDLAETLATWRRESHLWLGIAAFMLLSAALGVAVFSHRRAHAYALARLREEARYRTTLVSVGDAVMVADTDGRVELMNAQAEALTGWSQREAKGRPLSEVFRIINEFTRIASSCPLDRVVQEGVVVGLANHTLLVARDGTERPIADSAAPVRLASGSVTGAVLVFRDQTEERSAQRRLADAEARSRAILAAIPDIVMEVDSRKVYTWANPAGLRFFGADVIGREAAEYFIGEQNTYASVAPLFGGDEYTFYLESWQRRQDGEARLLAWWCQTLKDSEGQVIGAISSARDITETRQTEQELQASEARFRLLADSTLDWVYWHAPDGRFLYVTPSVEPITGYRPEEFLADQHLLDRIINPEDQAANAPKIAAALATDSPLEMAFRITHRSGRTVWIDHSCNVIFDAQGRSLGRRATNRDVSDRKLAEAQAHLLELRAQQYLDVAGVMLLALDADGRVIFVNSRGESVLGYSEAELRGRDWFDTCLPAHLRVEIRDVHRQLISGQTTGLEDYENLVLAKDGAERLIAWHNALLVDEDGRVVGILSSGEDISERRQLERQLEEQRLRALQADRLQALGEMAAGIAHELNQPLNGIRAFAEGTFLGLERGWSYSLPELRRTLQDIVGQVDRMSEVIDHMRVFARDDHRRETEPFDLAETVEGALKLMGAQLRVHGIELKLELADDLPACWGHPHRLEQVVLNLLSNARDALDSRKAQETKAGAPDDWRPTVILSTGLAATDQALHLTVWDNGGGIPAAVASRIFEPFYTTKEVGRGTGLGLAIARQIVEEHGGRIEIANRPGDSVAFSIVLPVGAGPT